MSDDGSAAAIGGYRAQPFLRVVRFERDVRTSRFQNRHQRNDQIDRAFKAYADQDLRSDAQALQAMSEHIGARIQLAVRDLFALEGDGDLIGCPVDLRLDQRVQGRVSWIRPRCIVPSDDQLPLFAVIDERRIADAGLRVTRHPHERIPKVFHHLRNRVRIEPFDVVQDCERELLAGSRDYCQRIVGLFERAPQLQLQPGSFPRRPWPRRIVLEGDDALEKGLARRQPDPLLNVEERRVLELGELELLRLQFMEPGDEGLRRLRRHASRQHVDEQSDHRLHAWK